MRGSWVLCGFLIPIWDNDHACLSFNSPLLFPASLMTSPRSRLFISTDKQQSMYYYPIQTPAKTHLFQAHLSLSRPSLTHSPPTDKSLLTALDPRRRQSTNRDNQPARLRSPDLETAIEAIIASQRRGPPFGTAAGQPVNTPQHPDSSVAETPSTPALRPAWPRCAACVSPLHLGPPLVFVPDFPAPEPRVASVSPLLSVAGGVWGVPPLRGWGWGPEDEGGERKGSLEGEPDMDAWAAWWGIRRGLLWESVSSSLYWAAQHSSTGTDGSGRAVGGEGADAM